MTTVPLAEARARLSMLVEEAITTHQRVEVTKNGRRAVVILSADDYDSMVETLDILSDRDLIADIRQAQHEAERGEVFTADEITKAMREAGRLHR
jgi:antitoxin YefM